VLQQRRPKKISGDAADGVRPDDVGEIRLDEHPAPLVHSGNDVGRITDVRRDDLDVVTPAEVELSCE